MTPPTAPAIAATLGDPSLLARAQQARQLHAALAKLASRELFVDPAWDMMIELFIAVEQQRQLYVKDLVLLSGESATSAMRRIDRLQQSGLLLRQLDRADHRRMRVALTQKGHDAISAMLQQLFAPPAVGAPEAVTPRSFRPTGA